MKQDVDKKLADQKKDLDKRFDDQKDLNRIDEFE